MNQADVLELGRQALQVGVAVSMPLLLSALIAGVTIALFQAVTQVQEITLTFVPKILAVALALFLFGAWMLSNLVAFTSHTFQAIQRITQ
ncbi:MAG: flagellar biosynthesis protein FliQ [Fimbriimonadales bacterium]|nr:flagellar biosynthesis protein FliQ [Fimbriimonadales bacterium]